MRGCVSSAVQRPSTFSISSGASQNWQISPDWAGLLATTQWPEKLVFRAVCKALPRLFNDFLDDSMTSSCSSVLAAAAAALAVTHAADEQ